METTLKPHRSTLISGGADGDTRFDRHQTTFCRHCLVKNSIQRPLHLEMKLGDNPREYEVNFDPESQWFLIASVAPQILVSFDEELSGTFSPKN
jgi:hypothetical protein